MQSFGQSYSTDMQGYAQAGTGMQRLLKAHR